MVSGTEAEGNDGDDGDGDCDAGVAAARFIYVFYLQPQQPKRIAQALPNLISCRLRKEKSKQQRGGRGKERRKTQPFAWLGQMIYSVFLCILLGFSFVFSFFLA